MQEVARRFMTNESANIEVFGRSENILGVMKNLSVTGCYLELAKGDYMPREGDCIKLTLPLKTIRRTRYLFGQVVWNKGIGFGVTFVNKDEISTRMLSRF